MPPGRVITLLTDFGLQDGYVAAMKGVILRIAPHARLVDFTHDVAPQAIGEASFLLQAGYSYFPAGTVHLVVVDPGVGSERRAMAVATPEAFFVAPDNGVLAPVIEEARKEFGDQVEMVQLSEPRYWLPQISATFHGRDIFAPVAAHLLNGVPLRSLGPPLDAFEPGTLEPPRVGPEGTIYGQIVHVDRFGNCITNITARHLQEGGIDDQLTVEVAGRQVRGLYRTYSAGPIGVPIALISSSGHLELALPHGHASRALGVVAGDRLRVLPDSRT